MKARLKKKLRKRLGYRTWRGYKNFLKQRKLDVLWYTRNKRIYPASVLLEAMKDFATSKIETFDFRQEQSHLVPLNGGEEVVSVTCDIITGKVKVNE